MSLHTRLKSAIEENLAIARRMNDMGKFWSAAFLSADLNAWMAGHGPVDAIRQHEAALRLLERHAPLEFAYMGALCEGCSITEGSAVLRFLEWPCVEITEAAGAYGVPVDTEEESRL